MSRDPYGGASLSGAGGNRSPRSGRRLGELPTVDRSPSRNYPSAIASRGSPVGRKSGRAGATSPEQHAGYQSMSSPYYGREEEPQSPMMEDRGRAGGHHRSRSATRPPNNPMSVRYQSLDRAGAEPSVHDREFMPIREPRERSLERTAGRDRSLDRGMYLEEELYGSRSARQSPNTHLGRDPGGGYIGELQHQNNDLQRELANLKKELELTNQKLGSSMHSIKTFWSPELKKERALRKEESAKYSLINDQLKLLNSENQKQAMLVRQLEEELRLRMRGPSLEMQQQMEGLCKTRNVGAAAREELRTKDARTQSGNAEADGCKQAMLVRQLEEELRLRMRGPSLEMQQQMEVLFAENEHLTREIAILRETIKRSLSVILAGTFPGWREQVAHPDMHAALGTCNLGDLRLRPGTHGPGERPSEFCPGSG
ncbi:ELKS/Rab6-interacting/CAST family member 1-like [Homalodisca vitripennis]|uniref:ELKS/Rab6-interacting/CAST family member 1-like n=1 Tax=Homalodisca vitripennis TaxID=197043 RepID=UPI001EEA3A82|nr:ELKS/Rab6-interacting/CAST family member 1-like [Homalodisca vitripennis]